MEQCKEYKDYNEHVITIAKTVRVFLYMAKRGFSNSLGSSSQGTTPVPEGPNVTSWSPPRGLTSPCLHVGVRISTLLESHKEEVNIAILVRMP